MQLHNLWSVIVSKITDRESLCYNLNLYIHKLSDTLYDKKNDSNYDFMALSEEILPQLYKQIYDCAYLFNYYQLYIAIIYYMEKESINIRKITHENKYDTIYEELKLDPPIIPDKYNLYAKYFCNID
jgi:hypothetical protein